MAQTQTSGLLSLSVASSAEFKSAARKLRKAEPSLYKNLKDKLRDAGDPVLSELRAAVAGVDVQSSKGGMSPPSYSRGLRQRIGAATQLGVSGRAGIRFYVEGRRIDPQFGTALANYMNNSAPKPWRHPIFGSDRWTWEKGEEWFGNTIRRNGPRFRQACADAIAETIREIS